jgi:hypothetical protein
LASKAKVPSATKHVVDVVQVKAIEAEEIVSDMTRPTLYKPKRRQLVIHEREMKETRVRKVESLSILN